MQLIAERSSGKWQDPFGGGYTAYQAVSKKFAQHWKDAGIPVIEEIWNEPDLTEYYDAVTTVTMFMGNSKDYVDMYLAAVEGMLVSISITYISPSLGRPVPQ